MAVVRHDERDARFPRDPHNGRVDQFLLPDAVVLQLQVEVAPPEDGVVAQSSGLRALVVVRGQVARDLPGKARRKRDEPLVVLLQQLEIHAGFRVEAFRPRFRYQRDQVLVTAVVLAEQNQMAVFRVEFVYAVETRALRHVDLAADDRFYAPFLRGLVEIHGAVHHAVVGDGHRGHAAFRREVHEPRDAARAVQQAVFAVHMEMNKQVSHDLYDKIVRISGRKECGARR